MFIYLLYYNLNSTNAGSARINTKEREKKERQVRRAKERKGIEAQRAKPSTPSQAIDRETRSMMEEARRTKVQMVSGID